ncbi:MAG: hypothetical protein AAGE01_07985 [Pseudomonadota bacterium]
MARPARALLAASVPAALLMQWLSGAPWSAPAGQAIALLASAALYALLLVGATPARRWPALFAQAGAVLFLLVGLAALGAGLFGEAGWRMTASAGTALLFHGFAAWLATRSHRNLRVS